MLVAAADQRGHDGSTAALVSHFKRFSFEGINSVDHKKTPERVGIWHKEKHMWTHMATMLASSGDSLHIAHVLTSRMLLICVTHICLATFAV